MFAVCVSLEDETAVLKDRLIAEEQGKKETKTDRLSTYLYFHPTTPYSRSPSVLLQMAPFLISCPPSVTTISHAESYTQAQKRQPRAITRDEKEHKAKHERDAAQTREISNSNRQRHG
ncbi:hypothetical protein BKA81DRAFT_348461 [Phyllosticta paracitricarpa]